MEEQSITTIVQSLLSEIDQKVESYVQHWIDQIDDQNYRVMKYKGSERRNSSNA